MGKVHGRAWKERAVEARPHDHLHTNDHADAFKTQRSLVDALENGRVPDPVVEQRVRVVQAVFDIEDDEIQLDDLARHGGHVVEEPLGRATLIANLHAGALEVGDARGAEIAALGRANIEEAVVDADGVEQVVDRDVLVDRKRLLRRIVGIRDPRARVETQEEVVEPGALVIPVFGREKPERIREGLRVCRGADFQTQQDGITRARSRFAGRGGATFRVRKFVAVGQEIRSGRLRRRAEVVAGADVTRIVLIAHVASRHAGNRGAFERNDVDAERRHDRGLEVANVCHLRRVGNSAVGEQLIGGDDAPALLREGRVFRGELAKLHGFRHVGARDTRELLVGAAKIRRRVGRHGIAVVVRVVADDFERARVDLGGVCATRTERVATIAATGAPTIAIEVHVVVDDAVAIVIEVVSAGLVMRKDLAHAAAPASAIGFAGLCARVADADVVRPRRSLVAGLLLTRNAGTRSVLQNVPFAAVLRIVVAVGKTRLARAERADAIDAQGATVWRERTGVLTEAAVVFVGGEVVTTP